METGWTSDEYDNAPAEVVENIELFIFERNIARAKSNQFNSGK